MSNVLFRAVTVVDPQSEYHLQEVDIKIVSGIIQQIEKSGSIQHDSNDQLMDHQEAHLSPGWFDMHVHLNDPGYEWKEHSDQLSKAAIQGGFTELLCYPNTSPTIDQSQMVYALKARALSQPVSLHFCGTLTHKAEGKELAEIYDMQAAGALGFTDGDHHLQHTGLLLRGLQYMQAFDGLMIHYPSDDSLSRGGQMNEGIMATKLGMPGIPELAETTALTKFLHLLSYAGGRVHLQPISAPEGLSLISQAKSKHPQLSIGTDINYLSLQDESLAHFDSNYKIFPPIRSESQRQALCAAVGKGVFDVLSTGHRAQGIEEKQVEFANAEPGTLGLQSFYSLANMHLVQKNIIDISTLIELISINPRKILKRPPVIVKKGEYANVSYFQPSKEWTYSNQHIFSRAHNSPLLNQTLTGKVLGIYHKELLHLATD